MAARSTPTRASRKAPAKSARKSAAKPAARSSARPAAKPARKPAGMPAAPRRRFGLFSGLAVAMVAAGSLLALYGRRLFAPGDAGHAAPDLALDRPRPGPGDRAPVAFRPDPTAPVPRDEREALRPATFAAAP